MIAMAMPIAPGHEDSWRAWADELAGPRHDDFVASRRAAGVRERTFLQQTPMGQLVIVTLEGDDPMAAFAQMMGADDEFTRWFTAGASEAHGVDVSQPMPGPPPQLVFDTEA
jgi:hypothetical protein